MGMLNLCFLTLLCLCWPVYCLWKGMGNMWCTRLSCTSVPALLWQMGGTIRCTAGVFSKYSPPKVYSGLQALLKLISMLPLELKLVYIFLVHISTRDVGYFFRFSLQSLVNKCTGSLKRISWEAAMDQAIHHLINVRFLAKVPRLFILKDEDLMSLKNLIKLQASTRLCSIMILLLVLLYYDNIKKI